MWLLRGLRPDYRTIADFRRDNHVAFKAVFRAFVALCRKLDLFGRELLAVDGTRLKAVNSRDRNFTQAKLDKHIASADERLERYLAQLDDADRGEDNSDKEHAEALAAKIARLRERRQVSAAMLDQLTASGESQISLTDPDARAMVSGSKDHRRLQRAGGGRCQAQADRRTARHQRRAPIMGLLAATAGAARETCLDVERIDAVADMGYYKGEDIEACEAARHHTLCRPTHSGAVAVAKRSLSQRSGFAYDAGEPTPTAVPAVSFSTPAIAIGHERPCVDPVLQPCRLCRLRDQGTAAPAAAGDASTVGRTRRCSSAWRKRLTSPARHPKRPPGNG